MPLALIALALGGCFLVSWLPGRRDSAEPVPGPAVYVEGCRSCHPALRENSGYWLVERRDGASLVTYALAVRTLLPAFLTRAAERDSLVETINGVRRLAEKGDGAKP